MDMSYIPNNTLESCEIRDEHSLNTNVTADMVSLSSHSIVRAQQRGVTVDAVKFVALHGHKSRAKRGNMMRTMRSQDVNRLLRQRIESKAFIESVRGVQIITNEENDETLVVTVTGKMNK